MACGFALACGFAPACSNFVTILRLPRLEAAMRGVSPCTACTDTLDLQLVLSAADVQQHARG